MTELIISFSIFILNSIIFSGFIIPQVQKMKEIKDRIVKHGIEFIPSSGISSAETRDKKTKQDEDVNNIHMLFDSYRIRSQELSSLIKVYCLSILYAGIGLSYIYLFNRLVISFNSFTFNFSSIILVLHTFFQLVILLLTIKTYAIDPNRLQDLAYLVKEMGLNPHALISALDLNMSIDRGKELFEKFNKKDPLRINLSLRLRVFGFRFLYIVSDKNQKVFYISYGPITQKNLVRYLVPSSIFKSGEYNKINLGSFQFNLIKKQEIEEVLLIFLPFFKDETLSPMIQTRKNTVPLVSIYGGTWPVSTMKTYKDIKYTGEGLNIQSLKYIGNKKTFLKKIINKLSVKIMKAKEINEMFNIKGRLLEK